MIQAGVEIFNQSPIVAKPADELGKDHTPPKAHETPKPDLKVEPQPRTAGGRPTREAKPPVKKVEPKPEAPKAELKDKPVGDSKENPRSCFRRSASYDGNCDGILPKSKVASH